MELAVYMKEPAVRVLGPGVRYALWVQGCPRRCPGCVAENAWDPDGGERIPVDALAVEIALSGAEGLTVSGGEPFLQAEALAELLEKVKKCRPMSVIVYTGYRLEELADVPGADRLLRQIDLLIDGPYVRELDDGLSLRGSSNQRVIPLTDRCLDALPLYGSGKRKLERFSHGIYLHEIGIPDDRNGETGGGETHERQKDNLYDDPGE